MTIDEFATMIDRASADLPSVSTTLAGGCRFFVPQAAVEIVNGAVIVTASRGVLTIRRHGPRSPWTMRLALEGLAWPDDGDMEANEPRLVAALAAITGCPSTALDSTADSLRWLERQGARIT